MRSDFMLAINQLCAERKLSREVVMETVEAALISAYKRNFGAASNIEVHIDPDTGEARVYALRDIVENVQDPKSEILLEDARQLDPEAQIGGTVSLESTPRDFGRIAAQTAKQVILQRIREAERDAQYASFADSAGEIATGTIQSRDMHSEDVIVALEGAEAILPQREQVPNENYRRGTRLRAYVLDVRRGSRGPQITLSRRTPALLRRLLELEVPEIFNGTVEIKAIAREAGSRSKVAVHATQDGVDPVGSCVGVRGGRIQNVVNELGGEKIDVVQWNAEMATFIANALSPAKVMNVLLDDNPETGKTGTVIVPDRQLSLAIGKEGQNARLAAKLTGWRIDIKSASEAAEETLGRFEDADIAPEDMDLLTLAEALLRKQETGELGAQERAMVAAVVEERSVEDLDWPEVEPEAEAVAKEPEGRITPAEGAEEDLAAAEEGEAQELPVAVEEQEPDLMDEDDLAPALEGEDLEPSLGWIVTEPQEVFYDGWDEVPEEEDWEEEPDLDRLLEEEGGLQRDVRRGGPAKKKKKKGRRGPERRRDDDRPEFWK
jgi:N utilization substance protein A